MSKSAEKDPQNVIKCGKFRFPLCKKCGKFKFPKSKKMPENSNWNPSNVKKCGKFKFVKMSKSADTVVSINISYILCALDTAYRLRRVARRQWKLWSTCELRCTRNKAAAKSWQARLNNSSSRKALQMIKDRPFLNLRDNLWHHMNMSSLVTHAFCLRKTTPIMFFVVLDGCCWKIDTFKSGLMSSTQSIRNVKLKS